MTIQRNDILIKRAREASLNDRYGESYGVPQKFFITSLQSANLMLQRQLVLEEIELGSTWIDQAASSSVAYNAIASDVFAFNKVYEVWFSSDGTNFYQLDMMYKRGPETSGQPYGYYLEGGKIWLDYIPPSGTLRYRYEKRFDRLDVRRGTIESSDMVSAKTITLTEGSIDTTEFDETLPEYICVVDRYGTIKARNLPVLSWDSSTRTVTMEADYELDDGEVTTAGYYITFGADSTTHAPFNDIVEDFYIQYMKIDAYELNSSEDWMAANPRLMAIVGDIAKIYAALPSARMGIPETREDY